VSILTAGLAMPSNPAAEALVTSAVSTESGSVAGTQPESSRKTQPRLLDGELLSTKVQWYVPPRRAYTRQELLADRSVNFLGAGLAWLAALWLGYASWSANDPREKQVAFWLHGAGLIIMLNCSALYHYWAWDWKYSSELLTLDHVGISAMISGCYAPVMIQCNCFRVLAFVCCLGLAVVPMEVFRLWQLRNPRKDASTKNWKCIDILHVVRYLIMGWACVVVGPSLVDALPTQVLCLASVGGVLYTGGVFIFVQDNLQFHLSIWHSLVLLASVCFYLANLMALVGRPRCTS